MQKRQTRNAEDEDFEFTKRPICWVNRKKICPHLGQIGGEPACLEVRDRPNTGRKLRDIMHIKSPSWCPRREED